MGSFDKLPIDNSTQPRPTKMEQQDAFEKAKKFVKEGRSDQVKTALREGLFGDDCIDRGELDKLRKAMLVDGKLDLDDRNLLKGLKANKKIAADAIPEASRLLRKMDKQLDSGKVIATTYQAKVDGKKALVHVTGGKIDVPFSKFLHRDDFKRPVAELLKPGAPPEKSIYDVRAWAANLIGLEGLRSKLISEKTVRTAKGEKKEYVLHERMQTENLPRNWREKLQDGMNLGRLDMTKITTVTIERNKQGDITKATIHWEVKFSKGDSVQMDIGGIEFSPTADGKTMVKMKSAHSITPPGMPMLKLRYVFAKGSNRAAIQRRLQADIGRFFVDNVKGLQKTAMAAMQKKGSFLNLQQLAKGGYFTANTAAAKKK